MYSTSSKGIAASSWLSACGQWVELGMHKQGATGIGWGNPKRDIGLEDLITCGMTVEKEVCKGMESFTPQNTPCNFPVTHVPTHIGASVYGSIYCLYIYIYGLTNFK